MNVRERNGIWGTGTVRKRLKFSFFNPYCYSTADLHAVKETIDTIKVQTKFDLIMHEYFKFNCYYNV